MTRRYFSERKSKSQRSIELDFDTMKKLFLNIYKRFERNYYFQEAFGYYCVDAGDVPGTLGIEINSEIILALRKDFLWPIERQIDDYEEDDLFDMIEFLHDQISEPIDGRYHNYYNCGMHYNSFNKESGQKQYRDEVNKILRDYGVHYELNENGEIITLASPGLEELFVEETPELDPDNVDNRIRNAIRKFRLYHSTPADRRDAIRDLADVLEYLRPQYADLISSKDEGDLFNLANNFGIRHHNTLQKTDYDQEIWYPWMFYYYLSTIHAVVKLIDKNKS